MPVPDSGDWPTLVVDACLTSGPRPPAHHVDDDRAVILTLGGGYTEIDRATGHCRIYAPQRLEPHELVHPELAGPAGVMAQWHGLTATHAGGIVIDGVAWGVLGDKEAGKTTLLAHLHAAGHDVLADDVVITGKGLAYAGPRGLDLRPGAAEAFRTHGTVLPVRGGERFRMPLRPIPFTVPFGGWVVLGVAERTSVARVPVAERLQWLAPQIMMGQNDRHARLEQIALPMWRLDRPKTWSSLESAEDALIATLAD